MQENRHYLTGLLNGEGFYLIYLKLEDINKRCRCDAAAFVDECEQTYSAVIEDIADHICANRHERPILLLNGPSSSGKTTTARRIRDAVQRKGVPSHAISMDDYYLSRNSYTMPLDEDGNVDLESPLCMDLSLLSTHLAALVDGKAIQVPKYDFVKRERSKEREEIHLKSGEIAVIEGIHSFNKVITGKLNEHATCVYMAVGTQVVIRNEWRLAPHVLRFIRRAIRDNNFRNSPILETIDLWKSVRRGEELYIHPYTSAATHIIDTYLPYEDCILVNQLREYTQPYLQNMINAGFEDLVEALDLFAPISNRDLIPPQSIMHEFIG